MQAALKQEWIRVSCLQGEVAVAETVTEVVSAIEVKVETELSAKQVEIARLRAAEKFVQKETGTHLCKVCGFSYSPTVETKGVILGTPFNELPAGAFSRVLPSVSFF